MPITAHWPPHFKLKLILTLSTLLFKLKLKIIFTVSLNH